MYVYFPNVPESAWEDYNAIRGVVEMVGITRRPSTTTKVPVLELEGKSIMRPGSSSFRANVDLVSLARAGAPSKKVIFGSAR